MKRALLAAALLLLTLAVPAHAEEASELINFGAVADAAPPEASELL